MSDGSEKLAGIVNVGDEIKESIKNLCEEIERYSPPDMLLDLHRRTIA